MERYSEYVTRNNWKKSEYLQSWIAGKIVQNFLEIVVVSPKDVSILEIGSGLGRIAKVCKALDFDRYAAIEPNPNLARQTRIMAPQSSKVIETYLPVVPEEFVGAFDLVMSFHVLEHAPDAYMARDWIQSMNQMTKNGGFLLISGPDIRDYKEQFWDSDWSHGFALTPNRVTQIFKDLEIEVVYAGTLHFGSRKALPRFMARIISRLIPTRIGDSITNKIFGRPLATGIKIALLWGITFVVGKTKK
jgi:SAM-dependent methyltransferase